MSVPDQKKEPHDGSLNLAISNAIVSLVREYTGRGPTKARTIVNGDLIVVVLEDSLTKGEQMLVNKGETEGVLTMRRQFQYAMRDDCVVKVAELTGRRVVAMLSANHIDPDLAVETFVLDGARPAA
jgi:uncharacterized protein YbcI